MCSRKFSCQRYVQTNTATWWGLSLPLFWRYQWKIRPQWFYFIGINLKQPCALSLIYSCPHIEAVCFMVVNTVMYSFVFYRTSPSWRRWNKKPSCCPKWNILILWLLERHLKVIPHTAPLPLKPVTRYFGYIQLFELWCLFSRWPPVHHYGVLQRRRSASEDSATEKQPVWCWKCIHVLLILQLHVHRFVLY